ncbi:hypothetical protein LIPSTDRAFT_317426 [Lipomyces starkeyi NRRL Y-11557]|uniref:Uncharacterized protein n=1 Tax=Lipomyces starkeyi NRRL Y-11557 TaxID=675824 RepID=A0A1E3Q310_LIPST|nr:hypothetical protein LIPSTDRAFT_317426 [Lipomyces starkeyi NRRL Y-11557]
MVLWLRLKENVHITGMPRSARGGEGPSQIGTVGRCREMDGRSVRSTARPCAHHTVFGHQIDALRLSRHALATNARAQFRIACSRQRTDHSVDASPSRRRLDLLEYPEQGLELATSPDSYAIDDPAYSSTSLQLLASALIPRPSRGVSIKYVRWVLSTS